MSSLVRRIQRAQQRRLLPGRRGNPGDPKRGLWLGVTGKPPKRKGPSRGSRRGKRTKGIRP